MEAPLELEEKWPKVQNRVGEVTMASLLLTPKLYLSFRTLYQDVRVCVANHGK
jgi:hypothetical protein